MNAKIKKSVQDRYNWPYYKGWAPVVAMVLQAVVAGGSAYTLSYMYEINLWVSLGISALAGLGFGIVYNWIALKIGWEKLHWLDLLFGMDPFVLP